jgi:hypothetical protein
MGGAFSQVFINKLAYKLCYVLSVPLYVFSRSPKSGLQDECSMLMVLGMPSYHIH